MRHPTRPMTPDRWQQIEHLLDEVLACAAEERAAFLDDACGDDIALRREVEALLAAEEVAPAFLDADAVAFAAPALDGMPVTTVAGRRVGPYRLVREVGHGGMGVVYLAEREDVGRQVALKLVRGGLADPGATERFLFEQRVLARLEHPHIARLYDVGVTADRSPYFAMEYIEGQPLNVYCDAHHLGIEARLRLFETVGQAVQHAHQHFVVHRDLKPSNILVTEDDAGRPQVKLLDFGIAKIMADAEEGAPAQTLTAAGHRLMTPAYAAPEQIKGEAVTAMTDVYSLGVVLYELLTGQRPYEATGPGAAQAVLTQEPKRPSTAIAITGERTGTITETAEARATTAERLRRRLRGDLDVICLKALQKEPERRYASAEAFVEDIKRHLAGLPVTARPDTVSYRLRKFARRHRTGVAITAAGILLLALVVGFYTVRLQHERDQARAEATKAKRVTAFLEELFQASDPFGEVQGDTLRARDLLERGAQKIEADLTAEPEVQAALMKVIGSVYMQLGLYDQAQPLLERALALQQETLDPQHPALAEGLRALGTLRDATGQYPAAESLFVRALSIDRATLGKQHPDIAQDLHLLGSTKHEQGDYAAAESLHHAALAMRRTLLGEDHLAVAKSLHELARLEGAKSNYAAAESLDQAVLAIYRRLYGAEHPEVASRLQDIAYLQRRQGKFKSAEANYRSALAMQRALLGEDHPEVATILNNLGVLLGIAGRYDEVEPLFQEALHIRQTRYGPTHPLVASTLHNLAMLEQKREDLGAAAAYQRKALAIQRALHGETHPLIASGIEMLGHIAFNQGNYAEAERYYRESLAMKRQFFEGNHELVAQALNNVGAALFEQGKYAEADPLFREALAMQEAVLGPDHPEASYPMRNLGRLLGAKGHFEEGEALLIEALHIQQTTLGKEHPRLGKTYQYLADLYEAWGQTAKTAEYRALTRKGG